ncbi:hypothetical protein CCACVL1_10602 [Corchorus capsularis]|uniref:Uncharacterized protein n=1 Tax=Corchorus capsularis TaxID=210143 RepID=A0A1R3IQI6_COCAP|nr:hypothetical protein CCACVL1_10602 [Corchorus capsularis]
MASFVNHLTLPLGGPRRHNEHSTNRTTSFDLSASNRAISINYTPPLAFALANTLKITVKKFKMYRTASQER